jgi:hypothetical protein
VVAYAISVLLLLACCAASGAVAWSIIAGILINRGN